MTDLRHLKGELAVMESESAQLKVDADEIAAQMARLRTGLESRRHRLIALNASIKRLKARIERQEAGLPPLKSPNERTRVKKRPRALAPEPGSPKAKVLLGLTDEYQTIPQMTLARGERLPIYQQLRHLEDASLATSEMEPKVAGKVQRRMWKLTPLGSEYQTRIRRTK